MPDYTADSTADSTAADAVDFASTAYSVDRECRRLGYPPVVRQRPRGSGGSNGGGKGGKGGAVSSEFVCVPALMSNCAALLALLDAGPQRDAASRLEFHLVPPTEVPQPQPQPQPQSQQPLDTNVSAGMSGPKAGRWKRLFSSRKLAKIKKAAAVAAAVITVSEAATEEAVETANSNADPDMAPKAPTGRRGETVTMASHLQQLLTEVRQGAERLSALACGDKADECDDSWLSAAMGLTSLQREVLYFQVRWPQTLHIVMEKLTDAERTISHLLETSMTRGRVEAGARARGAARLASMEAEVMRLRSEIRRCGRHRPLQKAASQAQQKGLKVPQKSKNPATTVELETQRQRQQSVCIQEAEPAAAALATGGAVNGVSERGTYAIDKAIEAT